MFVGVVSRDLKAIILVPKPPMEMVGRKPGCESAVNIFLAGAIDDSNFYCGDIFNCPSERYG